MRTRLLPMHRPRPGRAGNQRICRLKYGRCSAAMAIWDSDTETRIVDCPERSSDLTIGEVLRELTPQVLGLVVRRLRDFDAAEDAVQEASIAAVMQWPRDGVPNNPRAWLTQVAFRKMTDVIRRDSARRRREMEVVEETSRVWETGLDTAPVEDDTLVLLFMCCHPALTP